MRRLLIIPFILLFTVLAKAQEPVRPNPKQQEEISAAAVTVNRAELEAKAAQARYEAAAARFDSLIFRLMAVLKLSPDEYQWKVEKGELVFVKTQPTSK